MLMLLIYSFLNLNLILFSLEHSWFTVLCQFLLYSIVTQSYIYIHPFSHIIFHHVLPQEIGYSSLCSTVESHCLSILNVIFYSYWSQTPSPSHFLLPPPWQPQVCSLCLWVCFSFVDRFICAIFSIPHKSDIIRYLSLSPNE